MAVAVEASASRGPPGVIREERRSSFVMPKMKSKRGAAKRFRVRGSGSIKRAGAYKRHILTKKSTKRKRQMRRRSGVDHTNTAAIRSMLPYSS
jgi:large subunit ribosomal protein L35